MCVILPVPLYNLRLLILQTPIENLLSFTSSDTHHAPLLHLLLKKSEDKPIDTFLNFLHKISCLEDVSSQTCAHGLRAGKCYPSQAVRILCAASKSDSYVSIVKSLLQAETDINNLQDGMTPLMYAAVNGSTEILQTLLDYKATVDLPNQQQETSLLLACRSKQWQAARILFDRDANAFHVDINGQTPLHVAITNTGTGFIEYMTSQQRAVFNKLKEISSLLDACQFPIDIFIKLHPSLNNEQIKKVVTQACLLRNTDILQHAGKSLKDDDLVKHITKAYTADHFDCLDALLKCAEGRTGLTCPNIPVSLIESCKQKELINLTKFLVTKGKKNISENNGDPLRTAAKSGNLGAVQYLIKSCRVKVDAPDKHGATALLFACMEGHVEIVDILLKFGANTNLCADETPLTAACKNGQQKTVNRLLKKPPNINISKPNKHGMTPAEVAINSGHTTIAANLIEMGAPLSFKKISFHSLCKLGDMELVSAFLQECSDCQSADEELLNTVVKTDNCKLLQRLLDCDKVSKSTKVLTKALETACVMGTMSTVNILMKWDHGSIWRSNSQSLLYQSIKQGRADIVELLSNERCDLTPDSCPLEDLVKSKCMLKLVLECMSQPMLNKALIVACSSGHRIPESCVRLLLDSSADVNYHDPQTQLTPLLAAVTTPSEALVRTLLEYGADPNTTDGEKNSPLSLACDIGHHSIASLLLYNINDDEGDSKYKRVPVDPKTSHLPPEKCPLWISCLYGNLDFVTLLTHYDDNKANLNLQNEEESILEASHKAGQHEVVRLLLEQGADPAYLSTVDLKTACRYGYAEKAIVISHEAKMDDLRVCISEAYDEGFPETGLGIIISIPDEDKQKQLSQKFQHQRGTGQQSPLIDNTSDSESQENNILWKHFYSKKSQEMMELIKRGHNPNITNIHGTTLFQACVQDKRIHTVHELCSLVDINQKDSLGRNILFYVLKYFRGRHEQDDLFRLLVERGADMSITDSFGRTLLHEWYPQRTTDHQNASKLDISLEELTKHIALDKCDFKKQTPLHAAVLQENLLKARQLLEAGSCPKICDENNFSPFRLATTNPAMSKMFTSVHHSLEKPQSIITSPCSSVQSASFSSEYPASKRFPAALNELFHKTKEHSTLDLFLETFETPLRISNDMSFKNEFKNFCEIVPQFMGKLSDEIKKEDPLFAFEQRLSGSCKEGTKVVAMDEADILCLFIHPDWKDLDMSSHHANNNNFMKLASDKFANKHPKLVRKSCLSVHRVFVQFYGLIRKSLAKVLREYKNLYIREPDSILEGTYAISALQLIWSGDVIQWQEFSLDVVPAIPLTEDKIPKELNHSDWLHHIYVVPKWTSILTDVPYCDEAFRLCFSVPEEDFVHAMPEALRQGYKLTKVLMKKCMIIDSRPIDLYISSYNLKCKMFQCFTEMKDFAEKMKTHTKQNLIDEELQEPEDILASADQILKKLEDSIKIHYQESFFLKGCNLLSHSMYREDFRPLLYVRLCRAMLHSPSDNIVPWKCLTQAVTEQLVKEEHFQRESFVDEISLLKTMGLDVNWRNENGACLLYYMIKYGLENGVSMLVEWGTTSDDIEAVAEQLVKEEHFQRESFVDEISLLKTMGLDVNWRSENGACLLYYMIKYGLENGVSMLVEWGATSDDIEESRRSFIQIAQYFQQSSLLEVLLKKGKCTDTF